jgi:hypothetical protein
MQSSRMTIQTGLTRASPWATNCFDLDTGMVIVQHTVMQMIWPNRLLKSKQISMGKKGKASILNVKFLNRHREKFDWDNDRLDKIEKIDKQPKLIEPNFIAEIPGIEVEGDFEPILGK